MPAARSMPASSGRRKPYGGAPNSGRSRGHARIWLATRTEDVALLRIGQQRVEGVARGGVAPIDSLAGAPSSTARAHLRLHQLLQVLHGIANRANHLAAPAQHEHVVALLRVALLLQRSPGVWR